MKVVLRGHCQRYAWGKPRATSLVATLLDAETAAAAGDDRFAELWFGTHDSGPTLALQPHSGRWEPLAAVLGPQRLPFLLKVLSVAQALSLQAHPDASLAALLHSRQPDVYRDPRHKPELCLALTDFEALCSFRSATDLAIVLVALPELAQLVGSCPDGTGDVKTMFQRLMHASKEEVAACIEATLARLPQLRASSATALVADAVELAVRLNSQFPGDVGVLGGACFLNHVRLHPGEALFVSPGEPHAYIYGECAECMACSDNVVRAGLTPKMIDRETLLSMLTYRQGPPCLLSPTVVGDVAGVLHLFAPPVDEFSVADWLLPAAAAEEEQAVVALPFAERLRIVLVLEGNGAIGGIPAAKGTALLVDGNVDVQAATGSTLHMLIAMPNK